MGLDVESGEFEPQDYLRFLEQLEDNLTALQQTLQQENFGKGEASIGAELELYLINNEGGTQFINEQVRRTANDEQLTLELNRYNLEYNLTPRLMSEQPFRAIEQEILQKLEKLNEVAESFSASVVPIGILPTLKLSDFGRQAMTDKTRYHILVDQLIKRRGSHFDIDINGLDPISIDMDDVTLEGANTSFQVHYRVAPEAFVDTFNAFQLVTPLVLAISGNSPTLFTHRLWQETRIPLFKQSIDCRQRDRYQWHEPSRVSFGFGWARSVHDLFAQTVRLYPPLLPEWTKEIATVEEKAGRVPKLTELRMHQSCVWLWNRPVFDYAENGHLRIELRSLPAGPTAVDMVANTAFFIGLAEGIKSNLDGLLSAMPFEYAEHNFYRAAQFGLDAKLVWPKINQNQPEETPVAALIPTMLGIAAEGLSSIGIHRSEADAYLSVIERRFDTKQTGSRWQLLSLESFEKSCSRELALKKMLIKYQDLSQTNIPVSDWPLK